jgi:hypothetical protein
MTASHLKTGQPAPETSFVSNIFQILGSDQHNRTQNSLTNNFPQFTPYMATMIRKLLNNTVSNIIKWYKNIIMSDEFERQAAVVAHLKAFGWRDSGKPRIIFG